MKQLILTFLIALLSTFTFSQSDESYTIYMDQKTHLLRGIVYDFGTDSIDIVFFDGYYDLYNEKRELICSVRKEETLVIDINEFKMNSGFYYLVDPETLKLIRLCRIPYKATKEEK